MRRRFLGIAAMVALSALAFSSCGGKARSDTLEIEGPSFEPERISIQTLEPGPPPTPSPTPSPTPKPTPTPPGVPAPKVALLKAASGTQQGDVGSYCWSEHVGGPSKCYDNAPPSQPSAIVVKKAEKVLLTLDAQIAPNEESMRPFQGTRSGYPDQRIEPALETELTIDLPKGTWSMDLCATWHGRGQPICWLFKLEVR